VAYEDLLKSVEESAREKELELRNREAAAVDEIRTRARKQAGGIRQTYLDEANKSITTERNKLLYLIKAESKELLIKVRETAFNQAFTEAETRLNNLRSDPKYPLVFEKLVHIDPRDEPLCKKTLSHLNLSPKICADLVTMGGVVACLADNSVVISNTVESRLQRAKELKRKDIHAILTGA
jgi:V/A-type H+-transporting ATPase subunit E